jgi:beta-lactamase class A
MRSFILLLCLIPTIICAQNLSLEDQLKQAIKGKKAEIGIAVIIDGKDTVTVNNDIHYPLYSNFIRRWHWLIIWESSNSH